MKNILNNFNITTFVENLLQNKLTEKLHLAAKTVCTWFLHDKSAAIEICEKAVKNLENSEFTCAPGNHLVYPFDSGENFTPWLFQAIVCAYGDGDITVTKRRIARKQRVDEELMKLLREPF